MHTELAKTILRAQEIHEQSWVLERSAYTFNHHKAANMACAELQMDSKLSFVIFLLNAESWNDIQMWAKDIAEVNMSPERLEQYFKDGMSFWTPSSKKYFTPSVRVQICCARGGACALEIMDSIKLEEVFKVGELRKKLKTLSDVSDKTKQMFVQSILKWMCDYKPEGERPLAERVRMGHYKLLG